ncbi:MAG: TIGR02099 family protein, partial [Xanthomonadales bacterium]|nr:TIGR02099 family protein [Xanthomonadales bacterium]
GLNVGSAVIDAKHQLEASMHGTFDAASLLQGFAGLQPLVAISRGSADFDVGVTIDSSSDLATAKPHLSLASNLRGMALLLPAPLNKAASAGIPLRLGMDLPFAGSTLDVHLGEVLNAHLRVADATRPLAANIALGGPAQAAPSQGIVVHGHVAQLDLSGWIGWAMGQASGDGGKLLREVDIAAHELSVFGQHFNNLALSLRPEPDKTLLTVAGEQAHGKIILPASDLAQRGITAKFQRLVWPDDDAAQNPATDMAPSIAPAAVPPLHLWIGDLRLGHARLGETRFESYPNAAGMHIERLETHSPDVQISARGDWTGSAQSNHTHLSIDFSSDDLGRMLDAFGFPGLVAGGTTLAHIDGTWPGPPSAFSLANLDGSMQVHVEEGRILKVEPGVGRLFGLFSFRELPRRLSLDFGDLFQSGFSFNTIDGHFVFNDGNAQTQDLKIQGPSAAIAMRGRTGFRQHDYDQFIDVSPHVGVALPVVGALAAGPLGAAAGLAMQTLLGRGLGKAAGAHYHVTGSWDKPKITLLSRDHKTHTDQPAAATSTPAPAASSPAPASTSMPTPAPMTLPQSASSSG